MTGGVASSGRLRPKRADAIANVLGGGFQVAIKLEGGNDKRSSLTRNRAQLVYAVDGVDDFLDLLCD